MTPEPTDRDTELRRLLVAAVDAPALPRPRRGLLVAALAGCVLLGGVAGAASATAVSQSTQPEVSDATTGWVMSFARPLSVPLGPILHLDGSGEGSVQLGEAPVGASGIVIITSCESAGSFDLSVDGTWASGVTCDDNSGGGGGLTEVPGGGQHVLTIETAPESRYQVWAVWVKQPPLPEMSAQQVAELADGVVTRDEYLAAFGRYGGCLSAAGHDISGVPLDAPILSYAIPSAAVTDGSDYRCYVSQFQQVDMMWQIANEDASP